MYSARCGMSRSVVGMIDLAARHLENHFNIKVGAYGCGLYSSEQKQNSQDPTGVTTDPICAQFQRRETPNVHVIVETIVGKKRDENVCVFLHELEGIMSTSIPILQYRLYSIIEKWSCMTYY